MEYTGKFTEDTTKNNIKVNDKYNVQKVIDYICEECDTLDFVQRLLKAISCFHEQPSQFSEAEPPLHR